MRKLNMRIALLAIVMVSVQAYAAPVSIKVCYVPFNYETTVATTPSSIFETTCKTAKSNDSFAVQLRKELADDSNTAINQPDFDSLVVRLGIIEDGKPITFVDREGVVMVSYRRYQLPAATFISLKELLKNYFGDSVDK